MLPRKEIHMSMRFHVYERDIIAKSKFSTIPGFDWEDIAQELRIVLWQKLDLFKGKNGAQERTFANKVMNNKILDLAKFANRQKRKIDSYHISLDELLERE